ncbi:uridylate-specific endoribonuclease-like [Daphnia carinata]|uniref:uridylate-specific endoribonuclease-like n=1 Tax=Daphnia carinata TaxID=120202 RepID=UPI00257E7D9F|nr:uridylate-specific endoribonuclease-like [Daphnia carinata]
MKLLILIAVCGLSSGILLAEAKANSFREIRTSKVTDSCIGRCGQSATDPTQSCQCNPSCQTAGDCCTDFLSTCSSCASWGRCIEGNNPDWPCQCTEECVISDNCCPDYAYLCGGVGPTGTTTIGTATTGSSGGIDSCVGRCGIAGTDSTKPCQCNPSCQTYNDCCADFLPTCNTCNGRCTAGYDTKWPCQCNSQCTSYGNCCPDYSALCFAGLII